MVEQLLAGIYGCSSQTRMLTPRKDGAVQPVWIHPVASKQSAETHVYENIQWREVLIYMMVVRNDVHYRGIDANLNFDLCGLYCSVFMGTISCSRVLKWFMWAVLVCLFRSGQRQATREYKPTGWSWWRFPFAKFAIPTSMWQRCNQCECVSN